MIDFRNGGHRGSSVKDIHPLFDGHSGRYSGDKVHIATFHDFNILPHIRG